MEKEDVLKAGHCVEPFRGMQLCGAAAGINSAMAVRRAVEASDAISFTLTVGTARSEYKRRLSERAMGAQRKILERFAVNAPVLLGEH